MLPSLAALAVGDEGRLRPEARDVAPRAAHGTSRAGGLQRARPRLAFTSVTLSFGGIRAIDDLTFTVDGSGVTGLIGANGAGKTSVLNVINRFYSPQSGAVRFGDADILSLKPHHLARLGIARSFQNVALFSELSVLDNLIVGYDHAGECGLMRNMFGTPKSRRHDLQAMQEARRILRFFELEHFANARAADLSHGHRKLVDLGRALMMRPQLLLLDEPAAGISESQKDWLADKISAMPDEIGADVLLVEHDMPLVFGVCRQVIVLAFGRCIAAGTPDEIKQDPAVLEAYLGTRGEGLG